MSSYTILRQIVEKANENRLTKIRLKDWEKVIRWEIGNEVFHLSTMSEELNFTESKTTDMTLKCSKEVLVKILHEQTPFYVAYWITNEVQCDGQAGDIIRLGFLLPHDNRSRRVIFVSNCWLNLNMRFPGGASMPGADVPLIKMLLDYGVGIVQMPCPEHKCFGLEKYEFGNSDADEVRKCYRLQAREVVKQIIDFKEAGYSIVGVMGMNPSPSCGVEVSKGKGLLLNLNTDATEYNESGVFMEEIMALINAENIDVRVFGVRRHMQNENSESRLKSLEQNLLD